MSFTLAATRLNENENGAWGGQEQEVRQVERDKKLMQQVVRFLPQLYNIDISCMLSVVL